jgi:DMSO/TMAO reductase YedYZ molybdopterin-dependent catalytic subunit
MPDKMRVMTEKPLNAETPIPSLRSWITANSVFFDRNQGEIPDNISLTDWQLLVEGEVEIPRPVSFEQIIRMPKAIAAVTLECSGNGRSLLREKASGNPWTIGGVSNAVWGGVWLRDVLKPCRLTPKAKYVAFEGLDRPLGSAGVKFVRSIPIDKAMTSTLLAYEMNGEPLPMKHGFPLRALALGWTGANCIKWLCRIILMERPYEGFYMDKVYRVFGKGQDPKSGTVVTGMKLKSIVTQPLRDETLASGPITILGAAYAGEAEVRTVEVSMDGGKTWTEAEFLGPHERFAWRQWQYAWEAKEAGEFTILSRATDAAGRRQPMTAEWNFLGYGNNGIQEHAVTVRIR